MDRTTCMTCATRTGNRAQRVVNQMNGLLPKRPGLDFPPNRRQIGASHGDFGALIRSQAGEEEFGDGIVREFAESADGRFHRARTPDD
jgi:hypothetical protein